MKTIVIYYSLNGNTKSAAERIAAQLGCETAAIEPVKPIPEKGFKSFLLGGKQAMFGERPEIKPLGIDPKDYDLIVLGTPIWASKCAAPVWTFVNECPVPERIRAVFTLSGSGENVKCIHHLEKKRLKNLYVALSLRDRENNEGRRNEEKLPLFIEAVRVLQKDK